MPGNQGGGHAVPGAASPQKFHSPPGGREGGRTAFGTWLLQNGAGGAFLTCQHPAGGGHAWSRGPAARGWGGGDGSGPAAGAACGASGRSRALRASRPPHSRVRHFLFCYSVFLRFFFFFFACRGISPLLLPPPHARRLPPTHPPPPRPPSLGNPPHGARPTLRCTNKAKPVPTL